MNMQLTKKQVENEDIAHRYLHNQLSSEESVAFEEYLMEHPELLEQMQLDEVFMDSIDSVKMEQAVPDIHPSPSEVWSRVKWLGLGVIGAYASVALFSLLITTNTTMNIDRVVYVETVRSSDPVQKRIALTSKNEKMVLMLPAGFNQAGPFNISIIKADTNEVIAKFEAVPKTETDDIAIVVESRLFENGRYEFLVTDISNSTDNLTIIEIIRSAEE